MSRVICAQCHYPQSACVCSAIRHLEIESRLIVMQHPSEVGHAKNSVRLMQLVIPKLEVVVGEIADDFASLQQSIQAQTSQTYLLYPSDQSSSVNEAKPQRGSSFILLDGTWRKAFRMLQLNPWLMKLPALHLDLHHASNYRIRKSSRPDSLSTLEAAALTLGAAEPEADISALYQAFDAMIEQRLNSMPSHVRSRYS